MQAVKRWMVLVLVVATVTPAACGDSDESASTPEPAKVEPVEGTELSRLTLTSRAAERLDIKTARVRQGGGSASRRVVIPYAALIYDERGATWAYTSPKPLIFLRDRVEVERIDRDRVLLSEGPPAGTDVVTVGAAELFGTEFEVEH